MIKAVIIGFAHMHVNEIALYMSEQPDFELVAIADMPAKIPEITDQILSGKLLKRCNFFPNIFPILKKTS